MIYEQRHWTQVQQVARKALCELAIGNAETATEAVDAVGGGLGPARRADSAWLVEIVDERLDDQERSELLEAVRSEAGSK
ncbi:hypothetical protein [Natronosalvus halobius]|uniref:hypothetical protein n=1 Tax=Natronosalvus halobius TaxID=2953746 RepID=UPI00209DE537|nr:hypothetical protein [Natronosalvus halobius]USZ71983.1 hypothetical protein NGM15_01350 [Natronosalvus halobius]